MTDIHLIKENTDLSNLPRPYDWDVVIRGVPYYVVRIEGYVHSIGGKWGENDLWAYPRNEKPSYKNLIEFDARYPVCWGITYQPTIYIKTKWGETSAESGRILQITRNGEVFLDHVLGGIAKAFDILESIDEHPMELNSIDFDKNCVGRKVWWRSQPAVIKRYVCEQACVILEPDGIDSFDIPSEFGANDPYYSECRESIKADIFDRHIYWFRN